MVAGESLGEHYLSEVVIVVLLLFFSGCANASRGLSIIEQVENIIHEIIFVRVLLVMQTGLKSLLKDGDDVSAISG